MEQAAAITGEHIRPDRRTWILDPLYEDCLSTAALAILTGQDPHAAVLAVLREERSWRLATAPLMDEVLRATGR